MQCALGFGLFVTTWFWGFGHMMLLLDGANNKVHQQECPWASISVAPSEVLGEGEREGCKNSSHSEEKCIFVLLQWKRFPPQWQKGRWWSFVGGDTEESLPVGWTRGSSCKNARLIRLSSLPSLLCHAVVLALIIPKCSSGFFETFGEGLLRHQKLGLLNFFLFALQLQSLECAFFKFVVVKEMLFCDWWF